jgi:hypothetical protein
MLKVFDRMCVEYGFHTLNASRSVRSVAADLRRSVGRLLDQRKLLEETSQETSADRRGVVRRPGQSSSETKLKKAVDY